MNTVNYREDEETFLELLKSFSGPQLRIGTGYFNLQEHYLNAVLKMA